MSIFRRIVVASSLGLAITAVFSNAGAVADEDSINGRSVVPIEITVGSGFKFFATPEGDRYLVAEKVDPDGFILNHEASVLRTADVPPVCVSATVEPPGSVTQTVRVKNGCATQQRVKVLVAFSNDSACMILAPGAVGTHAFNILPDYLPYPGVEPRFDGLEAC